jgi:hypothetical protein
MSRAKVVVLFLVGFLLIPVAFIVFVIFSSDCPAPEYLTNDFGGCELVD